MGGGPGNNGNLMQAEHWMSNSGPYFQQRYGYDNLNRLTGVGEYQNGAGGATLSQNYTYDQWGNRTISSAACGADDQQFAVDTATNRLTVPSGQSGMMHYDAAGNLDIDTYTGAGNRTYDAENRMIAAANNSGQVAYYTYDGDGKRVRWNPNNGEVWQVYGMDGELLAEYPANGAASTPQKEYGYRNGQMLITADGAANVKWMVTDQLGTPRMILDKSGGLASVERHDYLQRPVTIQVSCQLPISGG